MKRRVAPHGHGMTVRETQIMERSDNGVAIAPIAAELGLKASYVRNVVIFYRGDNSKRRDAAIRAATQQLGERCAELRARMG